MDTKLKNRIKKLWIPRTPTKNKSYTRITPAIDPELFIDMYRYCLQDIRTEKAVSSAIPDLSPFELQVWQTDQRINARGVQVDIESMHACIAVVEEATAKYSERLCKVLGDPYVTIDQTEKLRVWAGVQGTPMADFRAETVEATLALDPSPLVREVLEIRQALGAKSIKKLYALRCMVGDDGRIRNLFAYCGAGMTGRWAGRGPQPQNLPNHGPAIKRVGEALADFKNLGFQAIEDKWGNVLKTVGSTLRGLFIAAEGCDLISSDFSSIEAVILAFLAEEQWRMDAFNNREDIYLISASSTEGISIEEMQRYHRETGEKHPSRNDGKTDELSLGYAGTIGARRKFDKTDRFTDDQLYERIEKWRDRSPAIAGERWKKFPGQKLWTRTGGFWNGVEKAAKQAINCPGQPFKYKRIQYQVRAGNMYCRLPLGREMTYHNVGLEQGEFGLQIAFDRWNSDSTKGPVGWFRARAWKGSLTENIGQGTGRDLQAQALVGLERCGYDPVLHTHDDIVSEVVQGTGSIDQYEGIMGSMPDWASDWPIRAADGWRGRRNRK